MKFLRRALLEPLPRRAWQSKSKQTPAQDRGRRKSSGLEVEMKSRLSFTILRKQAKRERLITVIGLVMSVDLQRMSVEPERLHGPAASAGGQMSLFRDDAAGGLQPLREQEAMIPIA